jgi:hypothetical protein
MAKQISICPNCGLILEGPEFLTSVSKMAENVAMNYDAVAGRFLCPRCNYSGIPIEVNDSDYKKLKFKNKPIASPLNRMNPISARLLLLIWALIILVLFLLPWGSSLQIGLMFLLLLLTCLSLTIPAFIEDKNKNITLDVFNDIRGLIIPTLVLMVLIILLMLLAACLSAPGDSTGVNKCIGGIGVFLLPMATTIFKNLFLFGLILIIGVGLLAYYLGKSKESGKTRRD